jgi:hypothetical protein
MRRPATARSCSTGSRPSPKIVWDQYPDAVAGNLAVGIDLFMGNGCGSSAQLAGWLSGSALAVGDAQEQAAARVGAIGTYLPDEWDTHTSRTTSPPRTRSGWCRRAPAPGPAS